MALLKEDGSLDIEWIDSLPLEEHMKLVGTFPMSSSRNMSLPSHLLNLSHAQER